MNRHLVLLPLLIAACSPAAEPDPIAANIPGSATTSVAPQPRPEPVPSPIASPRAATVEPRSCATEIGETRAAALVAQCRSVSPATRPPCNVANSCAMIEQEIARSCAMLGDEQAAETGCTPLPTTADAAAGVVRRYYAAIDAGDFGTAWIQWGDEGQPGRAYEGFARGFAATTSARVSITGQVTVEGAAGSLYATVPVTVSSQLEDGTRQRFVGTYVVRRVNDVDGASASQRRWHLASADLSAAR